MRELGGPPITICELPANLRGASWGEDDIIIFGTASSNGLMRVSGAGGAPEAISTPEQSRHQWPDILPGGAGVLFTVDRGLGLGTEDIALFNMETREHHVIIPGGTHPQYSPTGHIVYGVEGTLRAVAFDLDTRKVTSDPVPVVEGVLMKNEGAASFDLSETGSLVYVSGAAATLTRALVWVDRDGREEPVAADPRPYDPNGDVAPRWWTIRVTQQDGSVVEGLKVNEDTFSLRIIDQDENLWSLSKGQIHSYERIEDSTMPGYGQTLTASEVDDLVAYLSRSGRRAEDETAGDQRRVGRIRPPGDWPGTGG